VVPSKELQPQHLYSGYPIGVTNTSKPPLFTKISVFVEDPQ